MPPSLANTFNEAVAFWESYIESSPVSSPTSPPWTVNGNELCGADEATAQSRYTTYTTSYHGLWVCGYEGVTGAAAGIGGRTFGSTAEPAGFGFIYFPDLSVTSIDVNIIKHELGECISDTAVRRGEEKRKTDFLCFLFFI